ncbi:MAG: DUF6502 family protein [Steroidobacteraceae bacterium]
MSPRKPRIAPADAPPAGLAEARASLVELFRPLARLWVERGITPLDAADMLKVAFVDAAAELSRLRNGRVNLSHVAALTGLTRAEVRSLARGAAGGQPPVYQRALRVEAGWRSDPQFRGAAGRPRSLRWRGRGNEFALLVRRYAGDVPPRVIIRELLRLEAARQDGERVDLLPAPRRRSRARDQSLRQTMRLASQLVRAGQQAIHWRSIHLAAGSEIEAAWLRNRAAQTFDAALESLADTAVVAEGRKRPSANGMDVALMIIPRTDRRRTNGKRKSA